MGVFEVTTVHYALILYVKNVQVLPIAMNVFNVFRKLHKNLDSVNVKKSISLISIYVVQEFARKLALIVQNHRAICIVMVVLQNFTSNRNREYVWTCAPLDFR